MTKSSSKPAEDAGQELLWAVNSPFRHEEWPCGHSSAWIKIGGCMKNVPDGTFFMRQYCAGASQYCVDRSGEIAFAFSPRGLSVKRFGIQENCNISLRTERTAIVSVPSYRNIKQDGCKPFLQSVPSSCCIRFFPDRMLQNYRSDSASRMHLRRSVNAADTADSRIFPRLPTKRYSCTVVRSPI